VKRVPIGLSIGLAVAAALVLGACGGGGGKASPPPSEVERFCASVREFNSSVVGLGEDSDPAELRRAADGLQRLADEAPAEIERSMQRVADAGEFFAKNPGSVVPPDEGNANTAAEREVVGYTEENCGVRLGNGT